MKVGIFLPNKRLLKYAIGLAIAISLIISVVFVVKGVSAAVAVDKTVRDNATSYTSYIALSGCAHKRLYSTIPTQASNPRSTDPSKWYGPDIGSGNSYVYPSGKQMNCGDILKNVASIWGITDYGEFLKAIGYKFNESVPEYKWSGSDEARRDAFNNAVKNRMVNGAKVESLNDATKYAIYISSLEGDCDGTDVGAYSSTYKSYADSGKREGDFIFAKVSTPSGDRVYKREYGGSMILYGYMSDVATFGSAVRDQSCGDINSVVNATAAAYALQTSKGLCQTSGPKYTETSLINACANGAAHKSSGITFCKDAYRGVYSAGTGSDQKAERDACYVGQGNSGGGQCIDVGYADAGVLQACVNGIKNKNVPGYCNSTYPAPDSLNMSGAPTRDTNAANREACNSGLTLSVAAAIDEPAPGCAAGSTDPACIAAGEETSSCVIEVIGWIICPVVNFMASIADASFDFLATSFLEVKADTFNTSSSAYQAWSVMRNIANVAFVIAFIIVIFSQLTGLSVSNYGVKKMLPRLVIAAILVNVSFFITQIAIDLSNILGYSIRQVFDTIATTSGIGNSESVASGFATGQGFAGVAGLVLAGAVASAALYAMLSTLIPVLIAAVIALVTVLFILVARQAIVILLVILAPLAFVAFLLPNTEKLFKMWRKMLVAMLLVFPIIALLFGASMLASQILTNTFSGYVEGDGSNMFGQIMAAAVLVLPLFAILPLLKKSLDGIPVVGQMASKWGNRSTGNLSNKLGDSYKGSKMARGAAIRKQAREVYKGRKFAKGLTEGKMRGVNQVLASGIPITGAERYGNKALKKSATSAMLRADQEEVEDAKRLIENGNLSGKQRQDIAMGKIPVDGKGNELKGYSGKTVQKAAIQMQMGGAGSLGDIHEIVNASSDTSPKGLSDFKQTISQGALSAGGKDPALTGKRIDQISQGTFKYEDAVTEAISEGKYTAEAFAGMNDDARAKAIAVATAASSTNPGLLRSLQGAAQGIQASPELKGRVEGNAIAQSQLAGLLSGAPAPTVQVGGQAAAAAAQAAATAQSTTPTLATTTASPAPGTPAAATATPAQGVTQPIRSTTAPTTTVPSSGGVFNVNRGGTITPPRANRPPRGPGTP